MHTGADSVTLHKCMAWVQLTYPDTCSPTSFMNLYFLMSIFATLVQNSFLGFWSWQNMPFANMRTISERTLGTNACLLPSSVSWLMQYMIDGGQESGIVNFFSNPHADVTERLSSDSLTGMVDPLSLPKGLLELVGETKMLDSFPMWEGNGGLGKSGGLQWGEGEEATLVSSS